jgi:hypothetical protein
LTETSGGEDAGVEQSEALVKAEIGAARRAWCRSRAEALRLVVEDVRDGDGEGKGAALAS